MYHRTNGSIWDAQVPSDWTTHYYRSQAYQEPPAHDYDTLPSARPVQTMGVGIVDILQSPARSALRVARGAPLRGLGQEEGQPQVLSGGAGIAILSVIIVVGGFLSYQAGKAMAPSSAKATTWGWIGVPVGLFTGTLGLGIMGIVSNRSK